MRALIETLRRFLMSKYSLVFIVLLLVFTLTACVRTAETPIPTVTPIAGVITRAATKVVAASNSLDTSKAQADYVCDGTNDEVEIQAAIDALGGVGGRVLLLEGKYNIANTIVLRSSVSLEGIGWGAVEEKLGWGTVLTLGADVDAILISDAFYCTISNLMIDGQKGRGYTSCGIKIQHSFRTKIERCFIYNCGGNGISQTKPDLNSNYSFVLWILNNFIHGSGSSGVFVSYLEGFFIDNNDVEASGSNGIVVDSACGYGSVKGNLINDSRENGIFTGVSNRVQLIGNTILVSGYHGICLYGGYQIVKDNIVNGASMAESNTYDGIHIYIAGPGSISGNLIQDEDSKTRYGIYLTSHTASTLVYGNAITVSQMQSGALGFDNEALGQNNRVMDNIGYNPVGISRITVDTSPFTYTAGLSPETVYVSGGTVTSITKGGNDFGLVSGAFDLEPNESMVVTYARAPTMYKDIH